jgi:MarR family transcriptional regulator, organic hydroperoxide resistance regulator
VLESEFGEASDSTGLLLWRITNAWQAAQRAALAPFDLTHVQFVLLASLTWMATDDPVTQRDLADHAGTDPMMTSQVLRTLEAKGLVERRAHPTDSRARALVVTERGAGLANAANRAVEGVDRNYFGVLEEGRGEFTRMLAVLDRGRSRPLSTAASD